MSCKMKKRVLARTLAPEDIRAGMFVAIHGEIGEYMPFSVLCGDAQWTAPELVRVRWLPHDSDVGPRKVIEVCLPYILVKDQHNDLRTLDTRRYNLVRVSESFAQEAFRREARKRKRKRKCKRNK